MKTFAIDFASHEGHLACVDGDTATVCVVGRVNDAEFISLAEDVLKKVGWEKEDIERIACNVGPGGFTSVRGGVAFANALADQLKLPIAGYHCSALALARSHGSAPLTMTTTLLLTKESPLSSRAEPRDDVWWIHSTRSDQVFVLGGPWSEPTLASLDDVLKEVVAGTTMTGDLMDAHKTILAERGALFPVPARPEEVLPAFLGGLEYAAKSLVPWYGRGI